MKSFTIPTTTSWQQIKNILVFSDSSAINSNEFSEDRFVTLFSETQIFEFSTNTGISGAKYPAGVAHRIFDIKGFLNLYIKSAGAITINGDLQNI